MFEVIQADQEWEDPSSPNRPLSSYTKEEKHTVLDRYNALREAGKDENTALAELDISKNIIKKWRTEIVTKPETSIQNQHQSVDSGTSQVVQLTQVQQEQETRSLPIRPASSYSRDERKVILDRYDELIRNGKSMSAALLEVGVSTNAIRKWRAECAAKATLRLISLEKPTEDEREPSTEQNTGIPDNQPQALPHPEPPQPQGKRKILRNVVRQYSFVEKQALIDRFNQWVQSGLEEEKALEKLGLTYNLIYQWLEQLEAKKKLEQKLEKEKPVATKRQKTQAQRDKILTRYQSLIDAGMKAKEAAAMFEVSHATITNWLKRPSTLAEEQQPQEQSPKRWTPKTKRQKEEHARRKSKLAEYHSLRSDGKTAHQAAEMIGVSYRQVRRWIDSGRFPDLEGPSRKKYSLEEKKRYLKKYDQLVSQGYRHDVAVIESSIPTNSLYLWKKQLAQKGLIQPTVQISVAHIEPKDTKNRKTQNQPRRSFTPEQKVSIVAQFNALLEKGLRKDFALEKLDISNASIDRWRKQFDSAQTEEQAHADAQGPAEPSVTNPVEHQDVYDHAATGINIITQEKNMATKVKATKKTRKAKTTRVVKQKKKSEPDLTAKVKPGPTLPTVKPKAAKSKAAKTPKKGKRYSAQEKRDILAKYNSLRESGTNAYDAAKKVGISYITIRSWEKKEGLGRRRKGPGGTKPSKSGIAKSEGLSMVLPNGKRIEGLTVDQVIKIVKGT